MSRAGNPFAVLELPATASAMEIERQKQTLLGMLELGLARAASYPTALGPQPRTAELVREAAERLARPAVRLAWELWTPSGAAASDCLDEALELHAALESRAEAGARIGAGELEELGLAWDLAFESEDVGDRALDRAEALGAGDIASEVLEGFTEELERSLLALIEAAACDLEDTGSEILERVATRHADQAIERLELACDRYVVGDGSIDSWSSLTTQYWAVVKGRGDQVRSTAFYAIYSPLSAHAVDLFDAGDFEAAAREFRWLADRAEAIGDEEAASRERDNAEISASAWLRARQPEIEAAKPTSRGGSWAWAWVAAVVIMALLRGGRSCADRSPSYEPPPVRLENVERLNRELQPSIDPADFHRALEERYRERQRGLDEYAPGYPESPALPDDFSAPE